jgi:sulfatase maturation enzyme AslB (radical SAM superfamily)
MVNAPKFQSWQELENSTWKKQTIKILENDQWPKECVRCQTTELSQGHSIRLDSNKKHDILSRIDPEYLILGGVLDNVCNSACQSCNSSLSTKIGSLSRQFTITDNSHLINFVPMEKVVEIDLNGGEPTASPRYQALLNNLPEKVKVLRVNTNGSRLLPNIQNILDRGVHVIITLSLDGVDKIHDYVRWPIKWDAYQRIVDQYQELATKHKNLRLQAWTTLHALNLGDFNNIKNYASQNSLDHSWAYLETPAELSVRFNNSWTRPHADMDPSIIAVSTDNQLDIDKFIEKQDQLRNISIKDYI